MSPLVLVPQHFGALVFDRRSSRYTPFDRESAALLTASIDTPFDQLIDGDDAERDARERFFDALYDRGFFTPARTFAGRALPLTPPRDHLAGPLSVHLEVAAACNLTCTHCFAGELPRREAPLTLPELDVLFADLAALGAFRLGLTGGEPLLRRDILDVIDLATGHGLHPCITTNALLLTEPMARALGQRDLVWLNVSLDGATAQTNDPIRGDGTYDRVLEKLTMLRQHARFTLAFTLTSTNAHEARACAELAERLGAHTAVFRPLYPVGTAAHHLDLMPTFAQYQHALDALDGCEESELHALDAFSPTGREPERAAVYTTDACGAGTTVCSVSLGGDVNPCSFLGAGFNADNLRRARFRDIWDRHQTFTRMRAPTDFGGGCRARALTYNGSVDAPDPWITGDAPAARRHPLVVLEPSRRGRA